MSAPTSAVDVRPAALRQPTPQGWPRIVAALTRVEIRRLLRHPLFLAAAAWSAFYFAMSSDVTGAEVAHGAVSKQVGQAYFVLMGWGLMPFALATLIVLNLAALRGRRHGTDELYASLPVGAHARTAACLLAGLGGLVIAAVLVAVAYRYLGAGDGLVVDYDGRTAVPSVYELAQGPALVAVLGALGVALANWLPRLAVTFTVVFGLFAAELLLTWWTISHSALRWLAPFANSATFSRPHAAFPEANPTDGGVDGFNVAASGWHLLYLAALAALLAALSLLRRGPRRRLLAPAAGALAVLVAAAVAQLSVAA